MKRFFNNIKKYFKYSIYSAKAELKSEVADSYGISRQGVHDLIKRCNNTLKGYEEKLKLVEKFLDASNKAKEIMNLADGLCDDMENNKDKANYKKDITKIKKLAEDMIEDF